MYLLHFQIHQNVVRDLECEGPSCLELGVAQGVVGVCNLGFQVWMFELFMAYILGIYLATFQVLDNLVCYGFI